MLHPQLKRDTYRIASLALSEVQLMDNALFPWAILVPRVEGAREMTDLCPAHRHLLMDELCRVSEVMEKLFSAEKMNIAALGNMVPQLHVHVIARFSTDVAWPQPVWGKGSQRYTTEEREERIRMLRTALRWPTSS